MEHASPVTVHGRGGLRGTLLANSTTGEGREGMVEVLFEDGLRISVTWGQLVARGDGDYDLDIGREDLDRARRAGGLSQGEATVIPLVAEELDVRKRVVETGRVRISRTVTDREEVVDEPLVREEVEVVRVPIGRVVDGPVSVRQEGDTTIIPLVEEVLVVEKRLMLREELRVTRCRSERHDPKRVTLRAEEATVERIAPQSSHSDET